MDNPGDEPRPYPLNRYLYYEDFEDFCPFGHTVAEDNLEGAADVRHPTVMIMESGDLRSLFFTLWKNFSPEGGDTFSGASFLISDSHPAIVARNIIFLYLSLKIPEKKEEIKKWMAAVWAIWFCHELLPEHEKVLKRAIQTLVRWTESGRSWSESVQNPLRTIVRFAHPSTLIKVNKILKMWHNREVRLSPIPEFKELRNSENRRKLACDHRIVAFAGLAVSYGFMQRQCSPSLQKKNEKAYDDYFFSGSVFAEGVLSLPMPSSKTSLNLTFFERSDGKYTVDYNCMPYQCFTHAFTYSPSVVGKIGMPTSSLVVEDDKAFDDDTFLLANSVQQFSMWFLGVGKILSHRASARQSSIVLVFRCSDPIEFCLQLHMSPNVYTPFIGFEPVFDLIVATRHLTHYPPSNILFSSLPHLKQNGYLLMSVLVYKEIAPTAERLIETLFGFDTRMLPIICGARCIGHEAEYSSQVSPQLSPWSYATSAMLLQSPKLLVWQKVSGLPLKLSEFTKDMQITRVMCAAITKVMLSFFNSHPSIVPVNHLSTQAAIGLIRSFAMQLDTETPVASYQFWEPLCSLLKEPENTRSYLLSLEIHAHLIGIHLHLTVTVADCPLCTEQPLSEYLTTYAIDIPKKGSEHIPTFMVYIHDSPSTDILELKLLQQVGGACHIFDCLDVGDLGERNRLQFVAPRRFLKGHFATVIRYGIPRRNFSKEMISLPMVVTNGSVKEFLGPPCDYSFKKFRNKAFIRGSSFGKVTHHYGDGSTFESVVSLSETTVNTLDRIPLSTKSISDSVIELSCGKHILRLNYPHLVDYSNVKIKVSRKNKTVAVNAPRKQHLFCDEKPLVTINPDFRWTLPTGAIDNAIVITFSSMQFTKTDRTLIELKERRADLLPTLLNVKEHISTLFQSFDENFFQLVIRRCELVGLVVIHNRILDLQSLTPALDLSFCFIEPVLSSQISLKWQKMVPLHVAQSVGMAVPVYALLQKVLTYYARRTRPSTKVIFSERHRQLIKHRLSKHFTRAIVSPLFSDPDVYVLDMGLDKALREAALTSDDAIFIKPDPPKGQNIDVVDRKVDPKILVQALEMASRVQKKTEEYETRMAKEAAAEALQKVLEEQKEAKEKKKLLKSQHAKGRKCRFCGTRTEHIKKCARCGKVQYCGRECQKKHWKEHKLVCQQLESTEDEDTDEEGHTHDKAPSPASPSPDPFPSAPVTEPLTPVTDLTSCQSCGKAEVSLRKCPCHLVAYCSVQCQRNDWIKHKADCKAKKPTT